MSCPSQSWLVILAQSTVWAGTPSCRDCWPAPPMTAPFVSGDLPPFWMSRMQRGSMVWTWKLVCLLKGEKVELSVSQCFHETPQRFAWVGLESSVSSYILFHINISSPPQHNDISHSECWWNKLMCNLDLKFSKINSSWLGWSLWVRILKKQKNNYEYK